MRSTRGFIACLTLLSACRGGSSGQANTSGAAATRADSQPRLIAIPRAVQGGNRAATRPPSGRRPLDGDAYYRAVMGNVVSRVDSATPVRARPADETDLSNYQAASWRLIVDDDDVGRVPVRFSAHFTRYTSGVLVLALDTTLAGARLAPPFDSRLADSVGVAGLGRRERFAMRCRFSAHDTDELIVGVVRDSTREQWMPARLAWLLDTASVRIRPLRPDSIACILDESPD